MLIDHYRRCIETSVGTHCSVNTSSEDRGLKGKGNVIGPSDCSIYILNAVDADYWSKDLCLADFAVTWGFGTVASNMSLNWLLPHNNSAPAATASLTQAST